MQLVESIWKQSVDNLGQNMYITPKPYVLNPEANSPAAYGRRTVGCLSLGIGLG